MMVGCLLQPVGHRRRCVVFIHCFLDDSGKESQTTMPYVVMAGYFADQDVWTALHADWHQMLLKHGISGLHMRQLIPIEGEYKERGWDVPKRDDVISDFISAIKKANLTGIGIAIEMAYWRNLKKQYPDVKFGSAQEFCFQRILRKIVDRLHAAQLEGEVAILFDRDPEFAANRMNIFS